MPLRRALSIVLRTYKVGEADKIVVFFSRDFGKVRGIARGARRPKSQFGGGLEIGTEVELTFFEKESRELVTIDRCDIIRSRFSKLGEPVLASTLGYVTDLVDSFAPEREPNQRVFRLLRATVGALAENPSPETRARYFEAWLLRLAGSYPRRKTCPSCGRLLVDEGASYLASEHRLECRRCLSAGVSLSPPSVRYIESIWTEPPEELEPPAEPKVLREIGAFHYRMIQEQLDKDLSSHQVLEDLLRQSP